MKKNIFIWVIVAVILVAIGSYAYPIIQTYLIKDNTDVSAENAKSKLVDCTVSISNPRGFVGIKNGDLRIENANCRQGYVKLCGLLGIASDRGTVTLSGFGGLSSSKNVKITEGATESVSLKWCGAKETNTLRVDVIDEKGNQVDTKEVNLS